MIVFVIGLSIVLRRDILLVVVGAALHDADFGAVSCSFWLNGTRKNRTTGVSAGFELASP